jgi:hypothetical protein
MTMRSPRRAGIARADERLTGVAEWLVALGVVFLSVAFPVVAFLVARFLAVSFFAGVLPLALLAAVFLAGTARLLNRTASLRLRPSLRDGD